MERRAILGHEEMQKGGLGLPYSFFRFTAKLSPQVTHTPRAHGLKLHRKASCLSVHIQCFIANPGHQTPLDFKWKLLIFQKAMLFVLVCCGCSKKVSQTGCLRPTGMDCLAVLEAEHLRARWCFLLRDMEGICSGALPTPPPASGSC